MNVLRRREFLGWMAGAGGAAISGTSAFAMTHADDTACLPLPGPVRAAQIGTTHAHAEGKISTLRRSKSFELVGVVEPDNSRWKSVSKSIAYQGLPRLAEEQVLGDEKLQVVAVETEVKDLLDTAARCIAAGKHIHMDKPAGENLPAFRKLLDDATRKRLTVQMGYMFRNNPAFQLCFKALDEGWLGEVFSIDTAIGKVLDPKSRLELVRYRGGSMFELGCHVIDAVVRVLGKPRRVTPVILHSAKASDDLADNMLAVLEYPRASVTVRSALIEVDGGQRRQFVVCGSQGTFDIRPLEPPRARVAFDRPRDTYKKGYQDVEFPNQPRYEADLEDLARVVRGEKTFAFRPDHDLAVQETILLASGLPTT
jgi:predicted dehydrogenase